MKKNNRWKVGSVFSSLILIYLPVSPLSSDRLFFLHVEESRHAQTVFRDKSGRKRNLDAEKEEQRKKDEEKAAKDEKYAHWGKGFVEKAFFFMWNNKFFSVRPALFTH